MATACDLLLADEKKESAHQTYVCLCVVLIPTCIHMFGGLMSYCGSVKKCRCEICYLCCGLQYSYHMKGGCVENNVKNNSVWGSSKIRSVRKQKRNDKHPHIHTKEKG